jgi:hypothetical protein
VKSTKSVKTNIIWHRRLGLSVFLVLIFLAISGFALNHSPALKLSKINLSNNWLLSWYGLEKPAINGFNLQGKWLYQDGNNLLFLDQQPVAPCSAPLLSTTRYAQIIFALCADALVMLTEKGQLVESFSQLDGLPINAQAITSEGNSVYLLTDSAVLTFDPDSLALTPEPTLDLALLTPKLTLVPIPASLEQQLENSGPSISLETVILDLHSGRFFGQLGVLFIDIVGLLICILSITGLMAWVNRLRQIKQ